MCETDAERALSPAPTYAVRQPVGRHDAAVAAYVWSQWCIWGAASSSFHAAGCLYHHAAAQAVPAAAVPVRTVLLPCAIDARHRLIRARLPAKFWLWGCHTGGSGLRSAPILLDTDPPGHRCKGVLGLVIARQQLQHHVVDAATLDRVVCRLRCRLPHVNTAGILSSTHPPSHLVLHLSWSVTEPCFLLPLLGHTCFPHHDDLFLYLMFLSPLALLRT